MPRTRLIAALVAVGLACAQLVAATLSGARQAPEAALAGLGGHGAVAASAAAEASVTVDFASRHPISPLTYGIFFEEIGHAGDGGLYGELVQDRSFDALAKATGFIGTSSPQPPMRMPVHLASLAAAQQQARARAAGREAGGCGNGTSAGPRAKRACGGGNELIIAWHALPGTATSLTREHPLNEGNQVAMELTGAGGTGEPAGITNAGYWGVPVEAGQRYSLSLYMRAPHGPPPNATVSLLSGGDAPATLATASFDGIGPEWQRFDAELVSSATDWQASLRVVFDGPGTLVLDSVSLFPSAAVERGQAEGLLNPWPFRPDLLGALQALSPRFLRFPGGCYVEGDWLRGAFRWKDTLGRNKERPGHHNSMWGYWSTDGLGLFEYLLLSEELGAEPVWVVNNGIAHNDQVPSRDVWSWVQEALDGVEFISGPPDSPWGSVRAAMGRPHPWKLNYLAIGNEGCGLPWDPPNPYYKPFYWQNYGLFFGALRARYPHLRLIANCHMGDLAPTEIWEYHVYTNPQDLFGRRTAFDGLSAQADGWVLASEYAVTDGGGQGNLVGALAEAGFALGMERNGQAVLGGSYAPLFVNDNARPWPTNLIVLDNHRWFGIPSYHVQHLLAAHLGVARLEAVVAGEPADSLTAGASCLNDACDQVALKLVNFSPDPRPAALSLAGLPPGASLGGSAELLTLSSEHPLDENSFEAPARVAPRTSTLDGLAQRSSLTLPPWSLTILKLRILPPAAASSA